MILASAVVVAVALSIVCEVLIPITLAVLLSFVLAPLVNLLRRAWLGRMRRRNSLVAARVGSSFERGRTMTEHTPQGTSPLDIDAAFADPSAYFDQPQDVLAYPG
jgi:hypothetical protein